MIQVYTFHEPGSIPGIAGTFSAGSIVQVDIDTLRVCDVSYMHLPVVENVSQDGMTEESHTLDVSWFSQKEGE